MLRLLGTINYESRFIFYLEKENAWTSNQMITEGEAAILLETTRRAFRNQSQSKQRSSLDPTNQ